MEFTFGQLNDKFTESFSNYFDVLIWMIKTPSWNNFLYWLIFWVVFCIALEKILPNRIVNHKTFTRRFFWQDLFYVLFNNIIVYGLGLFSLTIAIEYIQHWGLHTLGIKNLPLFDVKAWHVAAQFALVFVLQDFIEFFVHYLLHRIPFLWRFHKIHHAQEELGATSAQHFHAVEKIVFHAFLFIPFGIIGYNALQYAVFQYAIQLFSSFFTHTNIKLNFGFFNYIINNPETHFWHHAYNFPKKFKYGVNYASVLNIWDLIFRTYYVPSQGEGEHKLGVKDQKDMPESFIQQFLYPFKKIK